MLDLPPKYSERSRNWKKRDKLAEATPPFIYDDIVELELASEFIKTLYSVVHKTKELMQQL